MTLSNKPAAKHGAVLAFFVFLTLVMTYPLALHATTAIAGPPGDGFIHLYEMSWFKRAIFDLHVWPLFDPEVFYPFGYNLALSHFTPSNTLPMMPIVLLAGPVAGFNSAVFMSFILSGFGAYLLVYYFTRNRWAGVLAGILYAFSAYRFHNLGAGWLPNLGTQWLPFAILYLDKLITGARRSNSSPWRAGALCGFFFALTCLSSWYHVYIAGVAVLVYGLARAWPWRRKLFTRRILKGGAAFALVAALMILPLALPLITYGSTEKGIDWPLISADDASASVDDLLLPSAYSSLWGNLALERRAMTYAAIVPGMVYLSIPALLLGIYAVWRRRPGSGAFLLLGLVGAILTMGLTLHLNGQRVYIPVPQAVEDVFSRAMLTIAGKLALNPGAYWPFRVEGAIPIPLPGMLFSLFVPFGSTMRVFHRFGMDSSLAMAALAGLGAAALMERIRQRQTSEAWATAEVPNTTAVVGEATLQAAAGVIPGDPVLEVATNATSATAGSVALHRGFWQRHAAELAGAGLIVIVLLDAVVAPLPYGLSDTRGQATDLWLKQQPGDFSVLQLPLIRGLNGPGLFRAAIHGKKISYGYGTFYPKAWRQAVAGLAAFPDAASLDLLRSWGVRYVLLGEGAYKAGLVDNPGDTWELIQERMKATPDLRLVQTFDEVSPVSGDNLSPKLGQPWPLQNVVTDRTYVYEVMPKER